MNYPNTLERIIFSDKLGDDGVVCVTVNGCDAELDPWVATTVWSPIDESKGTLKVVVNPPLELGVTVDTVESPIDYAIIIIAVVRIFFFNKVIQMD